MIDAAARVSNPWEGVPSPPAARAWRRFCTARRLCEGDELAPFRQGLANGVRDEPYKKDDGGNS